MTTRYFNLQREVSATALHLAQRQSPRLHMLMIVSLASAIGFLTTFVLLRFGIHQLWLRYACAASLAYGAFLGMLWCWLYLRRDSQNDFPDFSGSSPSGDSGSCHATNIDFTPSGGEFGGGGASGSFDSNTMQISSASDSSAFPMNSPSVLSDVGIGDFGDIGDAGEALPLVAFLAAVVGVIALLGAILASAWIVFGAPTFLGELIVDVARARGLYKHMIGSYDRFWLKTALRHTFKSFFSLLLLLMVAGFLMQVAVPNVVSLGQFIHYFTEPQ
jgi:hypothetical protein